MGYGCHPLHGVCNSMVIPGHLDINIRVLAPSSPTSWIPVLSHRVEEDIKKFPRLAIGV